MENNNIMKTILKYLTMFLISGTIYYIIECLFKGHASTKEMFILSGILTIFIQMINNLFSYETDFLLQGICGSLIITLSEAIGGYQWNLIEHKEIWDYSSLPLSFVGGQVNVFFSILAWIPLSMFGIVLLDYMEWKWFGYKKDTPPYYKIFGNFIFQFKK